MNKRLKVLLFTLLGIVVVAGLAVGGFFLLRASSSAEVYNLQIVDALNNPVNDTSRFLLTNTDNSFEVDVNIQTSTGYKNFYFTTSDSSVANVVYKNQKYFVEYYKVGEATITARTAYSSAIYDSFVLNVYNNFAADIIIGGSQDHTLHVFADRTEYNYNYVTTGVLDSADCNNMLIRVVDDYDKTVFKNISIDPVKKNIQIITKQVTQDSTQVFYLQTYYIDNWGEEHVVKNHAYFVDVVGFRIVDVQLLVSSSENFDEKSTNVWLSDGADPENSYLGYNEKVITNLVLSDEVTDLYFKVRIIYSNKGTDDVSKTVKSVQPKDEQIVTISNSNTTKMNCLRLQFNAPEKTDEERANADNLSEVFTVIHERTDISSTIQKDFKITYKYKGSEKFTEFANKDLYAKVVRKTGEDSTEYEFVRYEYIYWDNRYRRTDTVTDANGYIVGFDGEAPTCDESKNIVIG